MTVLAQHQTSYTEWDVLLHVLPTRISKILSIPRTAMFATRLLHQIRRQPHGRRSVIPHALDAARIHLLESHDKHTIRRSILNQRPGQMQPRRARRARIVSVVNRNGRHAELIENALA
jgi:hypothetical protein